MLSLITELSSGIPIKQSSLIYITSWSKTSTRHQLLHSVLWKSKQFVSLVLKTWAVGCLFCFSIWTLDNSKIPKRLKLCFSKWIQVRSSEYPLYLVLFSWSSVLVKCPVTLPRKEYSCTAGVVLIETWHWLDKW